jgi:hypothetical protein
MKMFKAALKGVKGVAQTTTTAFGNLASEIAGRCAGFFCASFSLAYIARAASSVLQPNSPQAMVAVALGSANKTRLVSVVHDLPTQQYQLNTFFHFFFQLARRLFYSFVQPGKDALLPNDFARFFRTRDEVEEAFALFDKDGNGDATRDEVEMVCTFSSFAYSPVYVLILPLFRLRLCLRFLSFPPSCVFPSPPFAPVFDARYI